MNKKRESLIPDSAIVTYTGKIIETLNPDPGQICVEDIAHALSNLCRFTGHTKEFYSVAQHSVLVSSLCPKEDAMWGLLHDATEAYVSDIARPIKKFTEWGSGYLDVEAALMEAVCERFGLDPEMPASVKDADDKLLVAEIHALMPPVLRDNTPQTDLPPFLCWHSGLSEAMFLQIFYDLGGKP